MKLLSLKSTGKLAWYFTFIIGKTLRLKQYGSDSEFYRDDGKPLIYTVWHGRMLIPIYCKRNRNVNVLVSQHRDGELISSSLYASGHTVVRGSTSRGGARALVKLIRIARRGEKVAFTPDGPRGPKWKLQKGVIYLAAKSGVPIVPITGSSRFAHYFKSWDSFLLPIPFSKAVLMIGEPYFVTGGVDEENIEFHRAEVEKILVELTRRADELAGVTSP